MSFEKFDPKLGMYIWTGEPTCVRCQLGRLRLRIQDWLTRLLFTGCGHWKQHQANEAKRLEAHLNSRGRVTDDVYRVATDYRFNARGERMPLDQ
jgi:hypothetical protein